LRESEVRKESAMRRLRALAVLFVLSLLVVAPSLAANGAVIFRGNDGWIWWFESNNGNLVVFSPEQYFGAGFCNQPTGEWIFLDYKGVWNPKLTKQNYWMAGPHFTRVYPGVDPGTYPGWVWDPAFLCAFLQTPPSAEGISDVKWVDINTCQTGPGQNTWSHSAHGMLYTPSTVCSSGMAKFDMVLKWMLTADAYVDPDTCTVDDDSHVRLVVGQGPSLKCVGK
jgi:hypothetical protein